MVLPLFDYLLFALKPPKLRVRDYDNLELKQIQDVIAAYVLTDDSGLLCDTYHTTELGEADQIRISIMEKGHFPGWLKSRSGDL